MRSLGTTVLALALAGVLSCNPVRAINRKREWRATLASSSAVDSLARVLTQYHRDHGSYPSTGGNMVPISKVESAFQPKYYDFPWPDDGWGTPVMYSSDGLHFEVRSFGSDRKQSNLRTSSARDSYVTFDPADDIVVTDLAVLAYPSGVSHGYWPGVLPPPSAKP